MQSRLSVAILAVCSCLATPTAWGDPAASASVGSSEAGPGAGIEISNLVTRLIEGEVDEAFFQAASGLPTAEQADLLALAVTRGTAQVVEGLLDAGVDIDSRNDAGWTPLMVALFEQDEGLAVLLIERGADPRAEAPDGISVPQLAEAMGSRRILWRLAEVSGTATSGESLAIAARTGDQEAVQEALDAGIAPDVVDREGWTPLLNATAGGHHDVMRLLLGAKADPDRAADGLLPSAVAVLAGDAEALGVLLEAGADPNGRVEGVPLLMLAVGNGREDLAAQLLDAGADPDLADEDGARPAELAQALGMDDLVERLGGPPKPAASARPEALLAAILAGDGEEVERILDAGVPVDATLADGWQPLHVAIARGHDEVASLLLRRGASLRTRTPEGDTALMLAVRAEMPAAARRKVVGALIEAVRRDDPDARFLKDANGRTALMQAVVLRRHNVLGLLTLGARSFADEPDAQGVRPIIAAASNNDPDAVKTLLDHGAQAAHPNDTVSLHDIARQRGSWEILARLPSDREFPIWVKKGMSRDDRRKVQDALRDWGYYKGSIDGILGPGSAAALKAFLTDRQAEVLAMVNSAGSRKWRRFELTAGDSFAGEDHVSPAVPGWLLYRWGGEGNGHSFFGFAQTDGGINNGFGIYRWPNGADAIMLLGPNGFEDEERVP